MVRKTRRCRQDYGGPRRGFSSGARERNPGGWSADKIQGEGAGEKNGDHGGVGGGGGGCKLTKRVSSNEPNAGANVIGMVRSGVTYFKGGG